MQKGVDFFTVRVKDLGAKSFEDLRKFLKEIPAPEPRPTIKDFPEELKVVENGVKKILRLTDDKFDVERVKFLHILGMHPGTFAVCYAGFQVGVAKYNNAGIEWNFQLGY